MEVRSVVDFDADDLFFRRREPLEGLLEQVADFLLSLGAGLGRDVGEADLHSLHLHQLALEDKVDRPVEREGAVLFLAVRCALPT